MRQQEFKKLLIQDKEYYEVDKCRIELSNFIVMLHDLYNINDKADAALEVQYVKYGNVIVFNPYAAIIYPSCDLAYHKLQMKYKTMLEQERSGKIVYTTKQ